jgi:hypothetical protein
MDAILGDEHRQREIRSCLPNIEERFGRERFQRKIKQITMEALS